MKVKIAIEFETELDISNNIDDVYVAPNIDDIVWAINEEVKQLDRIRLIEYCYLTENDSQYANGCLYSE